MNNAGGNHPNSQRSSGGNPQSYWPGTQLRPHGTISMSVPRPAPGTGVVQYFGPQSFNSNFVFHQPGTYNVGVTYNGNNPLKTQQGSLTSTNDWRPPSEFSHQGQGFGAHDMSSQTTPGLNKNNGRSPNLSYSQ